MSNAPAQHPCKRVAKRVIESFADAMTRDVFDGVDSRAARKFPKELWPVARRKLDLLHAAHSEADLRIPPSNRFEHLKGALRSRCSIRINDPFSVVFTWSPGVAADVQLVDYHR